MTNYKLDPSKPKKGKSNWDKLKRMTDKEIVQSAKSDPENLPLNKQKLGKFTKTVDVKKLRAKFKLSQRRFANKFGLSERTVQEWEQNRSTPDKTATVLLTVIEHHPDAVTDSLAHF